MSFDYSSNFKRQSKKLSKNLKSKVESKLDALLTDEFDRSLSNHKLHGEYKDFRSINVTGDLRIIYRRVSKDLYFLQAVGTHSELFS